MVDQHRIGHLIEVIGPVVDVQFEEGHLPLIHNAVRITSDGFDVPEPIDIVAEVEQHLGEGRVRCVAMKPTEGLVRGMKSEDLGEPISVPVGRGDLGPSVERSRRTSRPARRGESKQALSHSSPGTFAGGSVHNARNVRDRHQGRRSD